MTLPLSPELRALVEQLSAGGRREVPLDEIGDLTATLPVSVQDLDALFAALEERGIEVQAAESPPLRTVLASVLDAARALEARDGRRPTLVEIAARAGIAPSAARAALLYARVLARS